MNVGYGDIASQARHKIAGDVHRLWEERNKGMSMYWTWTLVSTAFSVAFFATKILFFVLNLYLASPCVECDCGCKQGEYVALDDCNDAPWAFRTKNSKKEYVCYVQKGAPTST